MSFMTLIMVGYSDPIENQISEISDILDSIQKSQPFYNHTHFYHSNTGLVQYSDQYCIGLFISLLQHVYFLLEKLLLSLLQ